MTVEEVKEYINDCIKDINRTPYLDEKYNIISIGFLTVKSMLDQLDEPKNAHYIEIDNRIDETEPLEYKCSNCKKLFYYDEVYNYCVNCGSKMENAREILGE